MNCDKCKFWRLIRTEKDGNADDWNHPHGECNKIMEQSIDSIAWLYSSLIYVEQEPEIYTELSLITHPDFGCNLFENK